MKVRIINSKYQSRLNVSLISFILLFIFSCEKYDLPRTSYYDVLSKNYRQTGTVIDIEGNVYGTIKIGTQWWMSDNLKTTKFKDGTSMQLITNNTDWFNTSSPAYCWYNNEPNNKNTYGTLYNSFCVTSGNLCPIGWHVPAESDWQILLDFVGWQYVDGDGKLKETGTIHWASPNSNATNSSGFNALPGGKRYDYGDFEGIKLEAAWWTSTESDSEFTRFYNLGNDGGSSLLYGYKHNGLSIRCLKD
jgi:uncharacterized protein (TIGR02145 family)